MFKVFKKNKAIIKIDKTDLTTFVKDFQDNIIQQFTLHKTNTPIISQTTLDLFKEVIEQLLLLDEKSYNVEIEFLDLADLRIEKIIDLNSKEKEIELLKNDLLKKTNIKESDALFDYKLADDRLSVFVMSKSFLGKIIDLFARNNMKLKSFGKQEN